MRLDRDLIKQQAQWRWRGILDHLAIDVPYSPTKHCSCPHCGGKDRFRFDDIDGHGTYICSQCGAGDGVSLVMKCEGLRYPQASDLISDCLGGVNLPLPNKPIPTRKAEVVNAKKQRNITELLQRSEPTGEPLTRYFDNRGTSEATERRTPSLRYHPDSPYWEQTESGRWVQLALCPAMIGLVTNLEGKVITLHRTFLTQNGEKAPYANPKKLMSPAVPGSLRGCSIKLGEPTDQLCLTEGIETALAVWLSTGIPTWACISANLLEAVEVPSTVKKINIMADKDRSLTGQRSAEKLARRLTKLGHEVRICLPAAEIPDGQKSLDWLDVFNRDKEVVA